MCRPLHSRLHTRAGIVKAGRRRRQRRRRPAPGTLDGDQPFERSEDSVRKRLPAFRFTSTSAGRSPDALTADLSSASFRHRLAVHLLDHVPGLEPGRGGRARGVDVGHEQPLAAGEAQLPRLFGRERLHAEPERPALRAPSESSLAAAFGPVQLAELAVKRPSPGRSRTTRKRDRPSRAASRPRSGCAARCCRPPARRPNATITSPRSTPAFAAAAVRHDRATSAPLHRGEAEALRDLGADALDGHAELAAPHLAAARRAGP